MQNAAFTELEAKSWMSHTGSAALFGEREEQGTVAQGQYIPTAVRAGCDMSHRPSRLLGRRSQDSVPAPCVAPGPAPHQPHAPGWALGPRCPPTPRLHHLPLGSAWAKPVGRGARDGTRELCEPQRFPQTSPCSRQCGSNKPPLFLQRGMGGSY